MESIGETVTAEPLLNCSYKAHKSEVNHVEFSPNSKNLVTCSNDQQVIFWELMDDLEVRRSYRLSGHKDIVHCVDYSPLGDYFVSVSRDKTACLWKLTNEKPNQEPLVYNCHCSTIRSVSISPRGDHFCTASDDKSVKVWSSSCKNKQTSLLKGHTNWIRCCKYCPDDDQLIASCGDDSSLFIHDLRIYDGLPCKKVTKRGPKFTCLDWYPRNKNLLAISSHDSCIRIFDLRTEKTLQYYNSHDGPVNSVEFHSSGNYLISSSDDCTSRIFDILEGRVLFTLQEHSSPVSCSTFNTDGKLFATVGKDAVVSIWTSNLLDEDNNYDDDDDEEEQSLRKEILIKQSNRSGLNTRVSSASSVYDPLPEAISPKNGFKCHKEDKSNTDSKKTKDPSILIQILNQLDLMTQSITSLEKRITRLEKKVNTTATF